MTREEAKTIFLNRGYIELDGGSYFDGNKWRESIVVISKWLKEEPCEDAISRQAILKLPKKTIKNYFGEVVGDVVFIEDIKALPPVTPKPRWIPVSERLPEPQDDEDKDYSATVQVTVHVCRDTYIVRNAYYCFSEGKWYTEGLCIGSVTAWMPLLEPYKTEGSDKE